MSAWKNPLPGSSENGPDNRFIFRTLEEWTSTIGGAGTATTLLYGSGAPTSSTGVNGNWYIDSTAKMLYGPKASGSWPAGIALVGPTGSVGPQGVTGPQGPLGGTYNVDGGDPSSIYGGILPLDAGGI